MVDLLLDLLLKYLLNLNKLILIKYRHYKDPYLTTEETYYHLHSENLNYSIDSKELIKTKTDLILRN